MRRLPRLSPRLLGGCRRSKSALPDIARREARAIVDRRMHNASPPQRRVSGRDGPFGGSIRGLVTVVPARQEVGLQRWNTRSDCSEGEPEKSPSRPPARNTGAMHDNEGTGLRVKPAMTAIWDVVRTAHKQ